MRITIDDRIKKRRITYFNGFSLNLKYNSVASSFSFMFYFNPSNHDQSELACVSHYHECIIEHEGQKLLTGYIISEAFVNKSVRELVQFAGYSKAGVLEDCEIPVLSYPLQSDGATLKEITNKLLTPFGIKAIIDPIVADKMEIAYTTATAKPTQSVLDFIRDLASQRNIVITHTPTGDILFTQPQELKPIFHVESGVIATEMTLSFNGQGMHSEITVMKEQDIDGGNAAEATVKNPFVPIVYRPKVIIQSAGSDIDTLQAAKNALADELRNIILTIKTDRWAVDGKVITPGQIITVLAPELYIYKKTKFFIEAVALQGDSESLTAQLTCVLPCVYDGSDPVNIFVDEHKNSGIR